MKLVSFNAYRSIGIPGVIYIKPENIFKEKETIMEADCVLFPEYWQVNILQYGLKKKIFPNINTYQLGHNKIEMTRAFLLTFPQNVPYTKIIGKDDFSIETIEKEFNYPFVAKEVKNSMGKGVFLIENRQDLKNYIENNEVLYIQERLPIDRDLRVVFVGDRVVASYWRVAKEGSFYNNIAKGGSYIFEDIPNGAVELVKNVANKLGIDHAGFDIAVVDDRFYILEFNVLFGNEGLRHLGIELGPLIYKYIIKSLNPSTPNYPPIHRKAS